MDGALINLSGNLTGLSFPVAPVNFNNVVYDTAGFYDAVTPTLGRLTVPNGFTKARILGGVAFTSSASSGSMFVSVHLNGASTICGINALRLSSVGFPDNIVQTQTPWLDVIPGDYFHLRANVSGLGSPTSILANVSTFMAIEALP